jgi:ribosomal protein L15
LRSIFPAKTGDAYIAKKNSDTTPVLVLLPLGHSKVLGKGRIPEIPMVVRVRCFSEEDERK